MPAALAERVNGIFRLPAAKAMAGPAKLGEGGKAEATYRTGPTRLRASNIRGRSRWIYSGFAVVAATLIAVLFIVPAVRKRDTTVSAAEILAKSANQLATAPSGNVDFLVYELV